MDSNVYDLTLKDIKFRGYHLRFKKELKLEYVIASENNDECGYYFIRPKDLIGYSLNLDGYYNSKEEFIESINEDIVVSWKLYVKDTKTELSEGAKRYRDLLIDLIEPIETFEDRYELNEFVSNVMIPPLAPESVEFCNSINKIVNQYGYKLICIRTDIEE